MKPPRKSHSYLLTLPKKHLQMKTHPNNILIRNTNRGLDIIVEKLNARTLEQENDTSYVKMSQTKALCFMQVNNISKS